MKARLARQYTEATATHKYIFGFTSNHKVYKVTMMNVEAETIEAISTLVYDSKSKTVSLRFKPNKLQKAKNTITYALIGLAIVVLSLIISSFVTGIINQAK